MEYNKIDQFVRDESEWGGYCQYKEKYTGRSIGGKKISFFSPLLTNSINLCLLLEYYRVAK